MKYRNLTDQDLTIIGVGICKAGDTIESSTAIENQNLELVEESKPVKTSTPLNDTSRETV